MSVVRWPWVRRALLNDALFTAGEAWGRVADLKEDNAGLRRENNVLRSQLTECTERIRLEDSLFRYLEIKGVELLK